MVPVWGAEAANSGAIANAGDATTPPAPHKARLKTYRATSGTRIENVPNAESAITPPDAAIIAHGLAPRCRRKPPSTLHKPFTATTVAVSRAALAAPAPRSSIMNVGIQVMMA